MEPSKGRRSLVVKVTVGEDAPERCSEGFTIAAAAASAGADVSLWLSGDAVWLATPGRAAGFDLAHAAPLDGMLDLLLGAGTVTVCHQCATRRGIALADLIPGIEMAGASSYVDEILRPDTQVVVH
ncbi:MAG: DsrE family protein [Actinomycetota bacterium]|jgi:predicted peroxiredoxin|nr:DsrE family protein [Actinomycetota bacterium]